MSSLSLETARVAVQPVRIAILGGNFGGKIARSLDPLSDDVRIGGVCDLVQAKSRALAEELGVPVYDGLDAILEDPEIEAVGVYTSPIGRGRLIERVLEAGKHVMTTKPFELDPVAARAAYETARRCKLALHLNSPCPTPRADLSRMREWLAEGSLGGAISFQARTWADYRERADGSWMDDPARCPAAPLFRLGVYFLNDFAALMGRPVEVFVLQSRVRTGRPTADNAQISIRFENGSLGNVFTSFCVGDRRPYADEVDIVCEHGSIHRWMERRGTIDMSHDRAVAELRRPGKAVDRIETAPGDFAGWYDWRGFRAAVRGEPGAVLQDAAATLYGVELLAAVAESSRTGLPVRM
jgi:predicted dehydrogenase